MSIGVITDIDGKKIVRAPWGNIPATGAENARVILQAINQAYSFGKEARSMEIRDLLGAAKEESL